MPETRHTAITDFKNAQGRGIFPDDLIGPDITTEHDKEFIRKKEPINSSAIDTNDIPDPDTFDEEDRILGKIDNKRNKKLARAAKRAEKIKQAVSILSKDDTPEKKHKRQAALEILSKTGSAADKKDSSAA